MNAPRRHVKTGKRASIWLLATAAHALMDLPEVTVKQVCQISSLLSTTLIMRYVRHVQISDTIQ